MPVSRNSIRGSGWLAALLLVLAAATGCAPVAPKADDPALRTELAPTGKLRVGLLAGNPNFVTQGTPPGTLKGVAVDIGTALAKRIGVPMEAVRYDSVAALRAGARNGEWDVAMLAIAPERAADMRFTSAYMYSENTLLVKAPEMRAWTDMDRSGNRIAAASRSSQEAWLVANLKAARVISTPSNAASEALVREGKAEAMVSSREQLRQVAARLPGARVLDGFYSENAIAVAVPKGRTAALAFASEFIEEMKASGAIADSIARAQLSGVRVAGKGAY